MIITLNRMKKTPDSIYDYRMIFMERQTGVAVLLPAGVYERMGKPRQLTLSLENKT